MNVSTQKFQSSCEPVCKPLAWRNQRTTLPQSRPLGVPAPSEREPGWGAYHSTGYSLKSGVTGDFHRPYETPVILAFTTHRAARRPGRCGRFSSPLRNSECFTAPKIFRFLTQKRYRVGQGTHVWEPSQSVTKNPLDGMYSGFLERGGGVIRRR